MERSSHFDLNREISRYLAQLNNQKLLSIAEEEELTDHLMCEIENLERMGLSTEEAFFLGQKRLGPVEMIHSEYKKAKPWKRLLQLFTIGMLFIFGLKFAQNLGQIISMGTILAFTNSYGVSLIDNGWIDLLVQLGVMLSTVLGVAFFIIKSLQNNVQVLWLIPVIFLISELIRPFAINPALITMNAEIFTAHHLNRQYVYLGLALVALCITCWGIWENRKRKIQLV